MIEQVFDPSPPPLRTVQVMVGGRTDAQGGLPFAVGYRRGSLMARSASMFFWTSVAPAPMEVKRCQG